MSNYDDIIRRGRACVRLIEAIDVLAKDERRRDDRAVLLDARRLALDRLRYIVREYDPAIAAQIMQASDNRLGTVKDVTPN